MYSDTNLTDAISNGEITVSKLVSLNYKYAGVFTKYGIDFCCGGKIALNRIIEKKNLVSTEVKDSLLSITENAETDFAKMSLSALTDHIIKEHHDYLKENIPVIKTHLQKVTTVHGKNHSFLPKLKDIFDDLSNDLLSHLKKEETILFRVIKYIESCERYAEKPRTNGYKTLDQLLGNYIREHENAGNLLGKIRELTNGFTPPADACTTFKVCYKELEEFETNTHKHVHLENNILFPKASELELSLSLLNEQKEKTHKNA